MLLAAYYRAPAPAPAPGPAMLAPSAYQYAPAPYRGAPAPYLHAPAPYRLSGPLDTISDVGRAGLYLGIGAIAILGAFALWKATR